ncbi:alpha/beta fold hydrolase [Bacillus sp. FJAT-52991]|uniref:Alpha/beta fold hydrolase n=1 Tax=Bacillus kandeliae TaxID=3129297 RepID=A0ABZ2N5L5_9BACI
MKRPRMIILFLFIVALAFISYHLLYRIEPVNSQTSTPPLHATVFVHGYKGTAVSFRSMLDRFENEHHWGKQALLCKVTKDGRVLTSKTSHYTANDHLFVQVVFENNRANFEDTTYWLSEVMNTLKTHYGIDQVNLVGHSMGGIVSTKFLEDYKQGGKYPHVEKLVVIGSPFKGVKNRDYLKTNTGAATYDLMPNSPAIKQLWANTESFPKHVKTLAIAGVGDQLVNVNSALAIESIVPKENYTESIIVNRNINHSGLHESDEVDAQIGQFLWNEQ